MADIEDELRATFDRLRRKGVLSIQDVYAALAFCLIPKEAIRTEGHKIVVEHEGARAELRAVKSKAGWAWEIQAPGIWTACDTFDDMIRELEEIWPAPPVDLDAPLTDEEQAFLDKLHDLLEGGSDGEDA